MYPLSPWLGALELFCPKAHIPKTSLALRSTRIPQAHMTSCNPGLMRRDSGQFQTRPWLGPTSMQMPDSTSCSVVPEQVPGAAEGSRHGLR